MRYTLVALAAGALAVPLTMTLVPDDAPVEMVAASEEGEVDVCDDDAEGDEAGADEGDSSLDSDGDVSGEDESAEGLDATEGELAACDDDTEGDSTDADGDEADEDGIGFDVETDAGDQDGESDLDSDADADADVDGDESDADEQDTDTADDSTHGQIVSMVARCAPTGPNLGDYFEGISNHGDFVRAAAQGEALTVNGVDYDLSDLAGAEALCAAIDEVDVPHASERTNRPDNAGPPADRASNRPDNAGPPADRGNAQSQSSNRPDNAGPPADRASNRPDNAGPPADRGNGGGKGKGGGRG